MKINLFLLIFALAFLFSCTIRPKNVPVQIEKAVDDSIQVVYQPYKGTQDLIEYEIPILRGTKIKHGVQKRFYRNGSLYSSIPYEKGKRQGTAYTYYQSAEGFEPKVWKEQLYEDNMLNGICKRYHDDGTLQAEYEYKNGNPALGLKEYSKNGKEITQPTLILTATRAATGYYVTAQLSKKMSNTDYFIGNLTEGKYMPRGLKGLQIKNGVGQIIVDASKKKVTITAVYTTRYRNKCLISKTINLQ